MKKAITKDIVCAGNGQKLETYIVGREDVVQRVIELRFEGTPGVHVRAYLNQEQLIDVAYESSFQPYLPIPVDLVVPNGQIFQAGFAEDAGATPTLPLTVIYEETPG